MSDLALLQRFLDLQQWERTRDLANRELIHDPESVELHLAAGQAALMLGNLPQAAIHLHQAIRLDPDSDFAMFLLSMEAQQNKKHCAARKWIDDAIRRRPDEGSYWYQSGRLAMDEKDFSRAVEHGEKALSLLPENADCLNLLALARKVSGTPDRKAIEAHLQALRFALEADPENAWILHNVGATLLADFNQPMEAEKYFRKALAVDPRHKEALAGLFLALQRSDWIFRLLFAPLDYALLPLSKLLDWANHKIWPFFLLLPLMPFLFVIVLLLALLWFVACLPTIKFYEILTVRELRQKAGLLQPPTGWLGSIARWPIGLRTAIFLVGTGVFWTALARWVSREWENLLTNPVVGWLLLGFLLLGLFFAWREDRSRRRRKQ
jgi:tetratricopeptide (TPR) repeat protein